MSSSVLIYVTDNLFALCSLLQAQAAFVRGWASVLFIKPEEENHHHV